MITGRVARHEFERARAAGCDAFLAKPVSYEQMLDEVKRFMHPAAATPARAPRRGRRRHSRQHPDILRDEGFTVVGAVDGDDALRYLRAAAEPPRLILLDLMMPVMDGWAFARSSSPTSGWPKIPVVILSAATDVRRHAAQLRVDEYLVKPLDVPLLLNAIERHI